MLITRLQTLSKPKHFLVHDPSSSLRTGDVVAIVPGWRTSKHKRHVIKHIIAPAGVPIEERPPVPTLDERIEAREEKKRVKDERRAVRRGEEERARLEAKALKGAKRRTEGNVAYTNDGLDTVD